MNERTLPVIQMFWHGAPLSRIERLCLASFVRNGHPVHLYVYEEPADVPQGVQLMEAGGILPRDTLFRHRCNQSLGAFADWFRYRLLFERGGVWADTDVLCLKPFIYPRPEIFAHQDKSLINNAVLGLPARHPLAAWMSESCEYPNRFLPYDSFGKCCRKLKRRLLQGNRRGNISWGEYGPIGFSEAVRYLGYEDFALPSWHFYPIHFSSWQVVFDGSLGADSDLIESSAALHLWSEMMRLQPGFDRNGRFPAGSLFETLWARYSDPIPGLEFIAE